MPQLKRRGFSLGDAPTITTEHFDINRWHQGLAVVLPSQCKPRLSDYRAEIRQSEALVAAVLENQSCEETLSLAPYQQRVKAKKFQSLGSVYNEGDEQEIETIVFDAIQDDGTPIAEDLWLKASWLSFHEDDPSLRFRFSFGVDLIEDVAADPIRQDLAAQLSEAIFPESELITNNEALDNTLAAILNSRDVNYVERIIYFNGPEGGAYLHHDLERGHAGVVYAQLSGQTLWLALPKYQLIEEIIRFSKSHPWPSSLTAEMREEMNFLLSDRSLLSEQLESFSNTSLIHLMNETEEFVQYLIAHGHYAILEPGDLILLPQSSELNGCWHSVFCLGEELGQALSFAIRTSQ